MRQDQAMGEAMDICAAIFSHPQVDAAAMIARAIRDGEYRGYEAATRRQTVQKRGVTPKVKPR